MRARAAIACAAPLSFALEAGADPIPDPPAIQGSAILDVAAAGFSEDANGQLGRNDPKEAGFLLQALELSLASEIGDAFRLDASASLRPSGIELDEAYGTTRALPAGLRARFGQFLSRAGRQNQLHAHAWSFVDQPLALGRLFGSRGQRGVGAELSWRPPLGWDLDLALSLTGAEGAETARSFYGDEDRQVVSPREMLFVGSLRQRFELGGAWTLDAGFAGLFGPNKHDRDARTEIYVFDMQVAAEQTDDPRGVALRWEAFYRRRDVPESVWDVNALAELVGRMTGELGAGIRYELGTPSYERGGTALRDPLDPNWIDVRHRISGNLTLWPTAYARLRVQASRDDMGAGEPVWAGFVAAQIGAGEHMSAPF